MARIIFLIGTDGKIEQHVMKAKGKACLQLTARLEKELGQVVNRRLTSEFYEEPNTVAEEPLRQKTVI
jgi:hypothetical protein